MTVELPVMQWSKLVIGVEVASDVNVDLSSYVRTLGCCICPQTVTSLLIMTILISDVNVDFLRSTSPSQPNKPSLSVHPFVHKNFPI